MKYLIHLTTILSSIGGLLYGYDIGVISGIFQTETFIPYFHMEQDKSQIEGNIVALLQAGACGGALTANLSADKLGRRKSVMLSCLLFMFGSLIQTGAKNLSMILFGRFAGGWGMGACSMLVPMYIAELVPSHYRGRMGALWSLNIAVGMTIAFWTNYGCLVNLKGDIQWRLPLGLQAVPGLILFLGMFALPESIRWLALQDRLDEAKTVLCRLRHLPDNHTDILNEFEQITTAIQTEKQHDGTKWQEMREPYNVRRILLGCFLQSAQQWTGTNAINYYGPLIFQTVGLKGNTSSLMTGVVKIFFCLVSFLFLDKKGVGRRPVLLSGSAANVVILLYTLLGIEVNPAYGYVGLTMIYLFAVSFEFTWGPMTWIVCSEIFPNRIRAVCISLTTSMNWAMNAIIGKVTPLMMASIAYGTFFFYAACAFVMGLIVYVFLPETQGKSLEQMDQVKRTE
ncbi:general substrate transporter [Gilbertella persicaria]|uniref:general substrate transporter n=1 Tax=Gilbertella persicaria TaxID=101096 RepID=UPI00221F8D14|nr:general substrate transporter [Gilbertella persicaria]KAI8073483.1 general substrate transporter [Gilbertella persicaria]